MPLSLLSCLFDGNLSRLAVPINQTNKKDNMIILIFSSTNADGILSLNTALRSFSMSRVMVVAEWYYIHYMIKRSWIRILPDAELFLSLALSRRAL